MKAVIQRVAEASVEVGGKTVGKCEKGFMILLGVMHGDSEADADKLVKKIINLRIFEDENEKMNLSALDINAQMQHGTPTFVPKPPSAPVTLATFLILRCVPLP